MHPSTSPNPSATVNRHPGHCRRRRSSTFRNRSATGSRTRSSAHAAHRPARARAPGQPDGARGLRLRQPLVIGLRHRGDPARTAPGGGRRRIQPRRAHHHRDRSALLFLILSYRQTIKGVSDWPGARMVTRDNFGLLPAQVAGVSLLTDYVLTVSVSTAAGAAALASAFSGLAPYTLWISLAFVAIIALGNLRGVKESGKIFATPTYFFIGMMGVLIAVGVAKWLGGSLHPAPARSCRSSTTSRTNRPTGSFVRRRSIVAAPRAFAPGGAAVTGVEAISNGVTAFRKPEWRNARKTLVIMGSRSGVMFLGLSWLATRSTRSPIPRGRRRSSPRSARPCSVGAVRHTLFFSLQAATMLILVSRPTPASPTSRGWPASTPATTSCRSSSRSAATASSSRTASSRSPAASSVLRRHRCEGRAPHPALRRRGVHQLHDEPGRHGPPSHARSRAGARACSSTAPARCCRSSSTSSSCGLKFTQGAWVICVLVPIMVYGLTRLNKQYESRSARARTARRPPPKRPSSTVTPCC